MENKLIILVKKLQANMNKTQNNLPKEVKMKKDYVPPKIEVIRIESECGIAANSAPVSPAATSGNTNSVSTDWNGNDDTTINTGFPN